MLKKSLQSCLLLKKIEAAEGSTATHIWVRLALQLISDILTLFFLKGCFPDVWLAFITTVSVWPDLTSDKANLHAASRVALTVIQKRFGLTVAVSPLLLWCHTCTAAPAPGVGPWHDSSGFSLCIKLLSLLLGGSLEVQALFQNL